MASFFSSISLTEIIGVGMVLAALWLIKIIAKKEKENFFRGIALFVLFLAAFVYINHSDTSKWTLTDIKDRFFPTKIADLNYRMEEGLKANQEYTRYIFSAPFPRLDVSMDKNGVYFDIKNPASVNRVLKTLNLPLLKEGVPELSSITGSKYDTSLYRWEKYGPGILELEKSLGRNRDSLTTYHTIIHITIYRRY